MTDKNGYVPTDKEVSKKMDSFDDYLKEGMTNIKDIMKAQKAEDYVGSSRQAAIIAQIGKERGITADILNDEKKAAQQRANLEHDFVGKGYTREAARRQADYTMNVWKVQQGVANDMKKRAQSVSSSQTRSSQPRQPKNNPPKPPTNSRPRTKL